MRRLLPLLAILCLGGAGGSAALERNNLRFYLSFEEDLQPRIAGPDTKIKFLKGTPSGAQLVEGRRGRGLRVTPALSLQYLTCSSFSPKEGSVTFWLKPVGWSGVGHQRYFLEARSDQVVLEFYMYYGNPWLYVGGFGRYDLVGGSNWQLAFAKEPFPEGQWVFMAGTYKPGQQEFYINGRLVDRRTEGLIEPEFLSTGNIEIPAGDQVLDEIMVFDRALTGQEITAIYLANEPELR